MNEKFTGKIHEHGLIVFEPKSNKDMDRLQAAIHQNDINLLLFARYITTIQASIAANDFSFKGVGYCPACMEKLISTVDDLGNIIKDIKQMVEKATPEERSEQVK